MNAEELMISDWVNSSIDEKSIQLDLDTLYSILCGYDDGIEPIPLTTEILKKNDFVNTDERWQYGTSIYLNESFGYDDEPTGCWIVTSHNIELHYVHELQHLLRLIGLDNLANNIVIN